jgi:hypothetical protein
MTKKVNRLASLLTDFSDKFELPSRIDPDGLGADLGIPHRDKTIFAGYAFDPSEDSYEFGAALGQVDRTHISRFSSEVLTSEPIRGITERVDGQGRFLVLGSRDGLGNQSDADIQRGYMDDVSRISKSYDQFRGLINRILDKAT